MYIAAIRDRSPFPHSVLGGPNPSNDEKHNHTTELIDVEKEKA